VIDNNNQKHAFCEKPLPLFRGMLYATRAAPMLRQLPLNP
jgi:hypothetical protein